MSQENLIGADFLPAGVLQEEGIRRLDAIYPLPSDITVITRLRRFPSQITTSPAVFGGVVAADNLLNRLRQQQPEETDPADLLPVAVFAAGLAGLGYIISKGSHKENLRSKLQGKSDDEVAAILAKKTRGLSIEEAMSVAARAMSTKEHPLTSLDVAHIVASKKKRGKAGRSWFSSGSTVYTGFAPITPEDRERWRKDATEASLDVLLKEIKLSPDQLSDVLTKLILDNLRNEDSQGS